MVKIEDDEAAFDKFLSILSRYPSMEDIYRRLRTTRGTYAFLKLQKQLMTTQFHMHSDEEIPEDERHSVTAPRQRSISVMQLPNVSVYVCVYCLCLVQSHAFPPLRDGINISLLTTIMCGLAGVADWSTCRLSCCCVVVEFGLLPPRDLLFKEPATCGYICWPRRRY